jgi:hypothetical protein
MPINSSRHSDIDFIILNRNPSSTKALLFAKEDIISRLTHHDKRRLSHDLHISVVKIISRDGVEGKPLKVSTIKAIPDKPKFKKPAVFAKNLEVAKVQQAKVGMPIKIIIMIVILAMIVGILLYRRMRTRTSIVARKRR